MNIQNHLHRINQFIEYSNKDDRLELEMRVKDSIYDKIDKDTFIRILKRIKGIPNMKELNPTETLEISYEYVPNKTSSIRVIINNQGSIKKYCTTNKLDDIRRQDIQFLKKRLVYLDSGNNVVVAAGANRENARIY